MVSSAVAKETPAGFGGEVEGYKVYPQKSYGGGGLGKSSDRSSWGGMFFFGEVILKIELKMQGSSVDMLIVVSSLL